MRRPAQKTTRTIYLIFGFQRACRASMRDLRVRLSENFCRVRRFSPKARSCSRNRECRIPRATSCSPYDQRRACVSSSHRRIGRPKRRPRALVARATFTDDLHVLRAQTARLARGPFRYPRPGREKQISIFRRCFPHPRAELLAQNGDLRRANMGGMVSPTRAAQRSYFARQQG